MTKKEKSAYLTGYEDGYLNALGYHFNNEEERKNIVSKLLSFYDAENADIGNFVLKFDEFYSQHSTCENVPVSLAVRIIVFRELGIKNEIDGNQFKFFENMLNEAIGNHPKE